MIAIGSDHGGFFLKREIMDYLKANNKPYKDFGSFGADATDYPDIAEPVAEAVQSGICDCGILICGTGIGMSIAANKFKGIRAAVVGDTFSAKFTKMHNDSNIICLGARVLGAGLAIEILDAYFNAEFEGGKHLRRIEKITEFESERNK